MRRIFIVLFLFIDFLVLAQCPNPGDVILTSQEEVDDFVAQYSNCTSINGNLIILGTLSTVGDVSSTPITNLEQLDFIEEIKESLSLSADITTLSNFNTLKVVRKNIEITNSPKLETIQDFNSLETVNSIVIALNNNLKIIDGFNNIETISQSLELGFSPELVRILGFSNLKIIDTELNFSENPKLIEIPTFNNLITIGDDVNFTSNNSLEIIEGFENLQMIAGDFNVELVKTIRGFSNLKSIGRFFDLRLEIEEIPSFNALETIGAGFRISNTNINTINGFNLLTSVGQTYFLNDWFILSSNPSLNSVTGFGNLNFVQGNFEVEDNPLMSDCSWMCNLLNNGTITKDVIIRNNPGNCASAPVVIEICDEDFDDDGIANVIDLDDDNDGILDTIENGGTNEVDLDNDGFPNSKDLDSDNDNCFDVLESGFNDADRDGLLGNSPVTVNSNGIVISDTSGYVTPNDSDNNSVLDFLESNVLNPGENSILSICLNNPPVDLFTILEGNPDPGGTWFPVLDSNSGFFNPLVDSPGIYTYIHTNALCGNATAEINVVFPSDLNSGIDADISVCVESGSVDLFSSLGGNPTPNGLWGPELASGTGVFNPNIDVGGVYTYTISNRDCGTVSSSINVNLRSVPNSGISKSISLCEYSGEINLFDELEGNPDTNGTWSPALTNNIFNTQIHSSNTYTYTVDNGACGLASSTLKIEVVENIELNNVTVQVNDFKNDNNFIEIFVSSNRMYEYSLDGINYQSSNIFNLIEGGMQKIYVRGADGCEFYEKEVFVKTYPNFFTPNNDGVNDFWQLKDFPNINYTVSIFNRYGKLVEFLKNKNDLWAGKSNGKALGSSTYWFKVETENGQILSGNFSLLRK